VSEPAQRLRDGTLGWHIRAPRTDDCFAPALASVLQVPLGEVPDPRIDERLAAGESAEAIEVSAKRELAWWLAARGLEMVFHAVPPVGSARWLGVVAFERAFCSHALVMCGPRIIWDPIEDWRRRTLIATGGLGPVGLVAQRRGVRSFEAREVTCGYTFRSTR
jgi:hypothetical protein